MTQHQALRQQAAGRFPVTGERFTFSPAEMREAALAALEALRSSEGA